jgi:hypothetical protein
LGGRQIHGKSRTWTIKGRLPEEYGWFTFDTSGGRKAKLKGEADLDLEYADGQKTLRGILVGDRIILDDARVDPDPAKLIEQTEPVFCVERGLDRFTRATVVRDKEGRLIYMQMEFPEGPEAEVLAAYQDRKDSVDDIEGVSPPLDLAFRWISYQRAAHEARLAELARLQAEEEAKMAEEERQRRLMKQVGTAEGRRALAMQDFDAAAKVALAVGGAEFLDSQDGYNKGEKVVQYRFRNRRLECVCNAKTLRIIDAGVCLDNHQGDADSKSDTLFSLETLPTVIDEVMDMGRLVVWRNVAGDPGYDYDEERW